MADSEQNTTTTNKIATTEQIESIKRQQTWTMWLVTAQLAVLAAIGIDKSLSTGATRAPETLYLVIGIVFSCISIIAASTLASTHSSIMLRIGYERNQSQENQRDLDIRLWPNVPISAWAIAATEHWTFVAAMLFYGIYLAVHI